MTKNRIPRYFTVQNNVADGGSGVAASSNEVHNLREEYPQYADSLPIDSIIFQGDRACYLQINDCPEKLPIIGKGAVSMSGLFVWKFKVVNLDASNILSYTLTLQQSGV